MEDRVDAALTFAVVITPQPSAQLAVLRLYIYTQQKLSAISRAASLSHIILSMSGLTKLRFLSVLITTYALDDFDVHYLVPLKQLEILRLHSPADHTMPSRALSLR
jgi:hypothetical protein